VVAYSPGCGMLWTWQLALEFHSSREIWCLDERLQASSTLWDFKFSRRGVWCSELSSGLYCRVKWLSTDVSEVRTASIIRDDNHFTRQYNPEDSSEHSSTLLYGDSQGLCNTISPRVFRVCT
jgi:hypothetical protein